jgi:hypothetical protein
MRSAMFPKIAIFSDGPLLCIDAFIMILTDAMRKSKPI